MTSFWDFRGSSRASTRISTSTAPVADDAAGLEMVELYTRHAMVVGSVAPDGRRLSDILNSNSTLALRDARSVSLLNGVEGSDRAGWTSVRTDEILLVMPPAHDSPRQMRVHRRQHRVRIQTGAFLITGTAHVLPGMRIDPFVLRSRMRFLALTDAHVSSFTDAAWERQTSVVLVNVRPIADLREVTTIS